MDAFLRAFGESLLLGLFFHHISSALRVFCWLCKFCVFCIFCIFLVLVPGLLRKALWLLVGLSLNWFGVVQLLVGMVWYGFWYGMVQYGYWESVYIVCLSILTFLGFPIALVQSLLRRIWVQNFILPF